MARDRSKDGFTKAENGIIDRPDLSGNEKLCWIAMRRFDFTGRGAWPSYQSLARIMSVSERWAMKTVASLQKRGLVTVEKRPGFTNIFRAILPGETPDFVPIGVNCTTPPGVNCTTPEEDMFEEEDRQVPMSVPFIYNRHTKTAGRAAPLGMTVPGQNAA